MRPRSKHWHPYKSHYAVVYTPTFSKRGRLAMFRSVLFRPGRKNYGKRKPDLHDKRFGTAPLNFVTREANLRHGTPELCRVNAYLWHGCQKIQMGRALLK